VGARLRLHREEVRPLVGRAAAGDLVVGVAHQHLRAGPGGRARARVWEGREGEGCFSEAAAAGAWSRVGHSRPARPGGARARAARLGIAAGAAGGRRACACASGGRGRRRRAFESVLFPEPFLPMIACTSPSRIVRFTPFRIVSPVATILAVRPLISSTTAPARAATGRARRGAAAAAAPAAATRRNGAPELDAAAAPPARRSEACIAEGGGREREAQEEGRKEREVGAAAAASGWGCLGGWSWSFSETTGWVVCVCVCVHRGRGGAGQAQEGSCLKGPLACSPRPLPPPPPPIGPTPSLAP